MKERIIEFLKSENKSSAQFSLEIGVQPSSISHIISGRNNPSLDFVMKMLIRYPALSADWLLFGKGEMLKSESVNDLFNQPLLLNVPGSDIISEKGLTGHNEPKADYPKQEKPAIEKNNIDIHFSRAKRIICFFENNTFTEYFPAKE